MCTCAWISTPVCALPYPQHLILKGLRILKEAVNSYKLSAAVARMCVSRKHKSPVETLVPKVMVGGS